MPWYTTEDAVRDAWRQGELNKQPRLLVKAQTSNPVTRQELKRQFALAAEQVAEAPNYMKPPANWPFPTYKGRPLPKPKRKPKPIYPDDLTALF